MEERLKQIREYYGMSQEAFGKKIGITKVSVSQFEHGVTKPSNATLLNIYREFDVNREWLETGEGEMFVSRTKEETLAKQLAQVIASGDEFVIDLFIALTSLTPSQWQAVKDFVKALKTDSTN